MARAFVRTLKRDYVRVNPTSDAHTVIEQLPAWLAHYNEVYPQGAGLPIIQRVHHKNP